MQVWLRIVASAKRKFVVVLQFRYTLSLRKYWTKLRFPPVWQFAYYLANRKGSDNNNVGIDNFYKNVLKNNYS